MDIAQLEQTLALKFMCARCNHSGARIEQLVIPAPGILRVNEVQPEHYLLASCSNCGYTEMWDLKTLERKRNLAEFLDGLFLQ